MENLGALHFIIQFFVIFLMESGRNLGEAINRMKIFQP
jgi:hypothetical protein